MAVVFSVPRSITVHLGAPDDTTAPNVVVPFPEYIKNVASSEIYPTWPESALRANIYAQTSFALNRIFTQHYRSRGYDFDITNSTRYDQSFVYGRDYFENIGRLADELFDDYIVRRGNIEPLFARYCNGTTSVCPGGMSQWGSVELANRGYSPYEILQYYYGNNIDIVTDAPVGEPSETYPGYALRIGSSGEAVTRIQLSLNRIRRNYPAIPKITYADGLFDVETENAVRAFQRIFNLDEDGIVGKATWYKINYIYAAVKRLSELDSEGVALADVNRQFRTSLGRGDSGVNVRLIQYYINVIAEFNDFIPAVESDGIFGAATENAVRAFQQSEGISQTGIVDRETWDALYNRYLAVVKALPEDFRFGGAEVFPGVTLRRGMSGESVRRLQVFLAAAADTYDDIPPVTVTGYFGPETEAAVIAYQQVKGLPPRGVVGPNTWQALAEEYADKTEN